MKKTIFTECIYKFFIFPTFLSQEKTMAPSTSVGLRIEKGIMEMALLDTFTARIIGCFIGLAITSNVVRV